MNEVDKLLAEELEKFQARLISLRIDAAERELLAKGFIRHFDMEYREIVGKAVEKYGPDNFLSANARDFTDYLCRSDMDSVKRSLLKDERAEELYQHSIDILLRAVKTYKNELPTISAREAQKLKEITDEIASGLMPWNVEFYKSLISETYLDIDYLESKGDLTSLRLFDHIRHSEPPDREPPNKSAGDAGLSADGERIAHSGKSV